MVTLRLSGKRKSSASVTIRFPEVKEFLGLMPDNSPITVKLVLGLASVDKLDAGELQWAGDAASRAEKARLTSRFESGIQLVKQGRFAEAIADQGLRYATVAAARCVGAR